MNSSLYCRVLETLMKKNLSKDSKFLNLLSAVSNEFNSAMMISPAS